MEVGPSSPHPRVRCVPLLTRTLPPATHTNCYLVGDDPFCVIDPGSADPAEMARLQAEIEPRRVRGQGLAAILVTHHHPDHVGGVRALRDATGAPVRGHPRLAE